MTEKELIRKICLLKEIKPENDWVFLTKKQLIGGEQLIGNPIKHGLIDSVVEIFQALPNYNLRPALIAAAFIAILAGTTGLSQTALPGDALYPIKKLTEKAGYLMVAENKQPKAKLEIAGKRLGEIEVMAKAMAKKNQESNLVPAIKEFRNSLTEATNKIKASQDSPALAMEIVREANKIQVNKEKLEALGVNVGGTYELEEALSGLVAREIKDLESRSLTEAQAEVLVQIKADFERGDFEQALEKILLLTFDGS